MRSCWRRFATTWPAPRSRARAIARSTRGLRIPRRGAGLAHASVARDARAGPALALTAGGRVSRNRTTARLSPRRPTSCGVPMARRVLTVDDGWVWTFAGRRPLECRVCGMARVQGGRPFRGPRAGRARGSGAAAARSRRTRPRGLSLRMDHGSQYLSDHFLNQVRYWGIRPSFGLLKEPETNGVVERWESHAQGAGRLRAGSFKISPTCAPPSPSSSSATTGAGASRSWPIARHSRPASSTSYAKPRSPNLCPRNRVRYRNGCGSGGPTSPAVSRCCTPSGRQHSSRHNSRTDLETFVDTIRGPLATLDFDARQQLVRTGARAGDGRGTAA